MNHLFSRLFLVCTALTVTMLSGCGGSKDATVSPTVSGIAATGLPIAGQIYLKDSSDAPRELSAPTGQDGSYVINVSGLTPPFLVKAQWTDGNGAQSLLSFANAPGTANVNPLSHLIVATAAGISDTASIYDAGMESKAMMGQNMASATTQVTSQLKPLLDAYGVTINPISGPFVANHTGLDAMLDGVKIQMSDGTVMVTNRASGGAIFTGAVGNIMNGTMTAGNIPTVSPGQSQPTLDGAGLYASHCASCHGALTSSTKPGASVARIQSAIDAKVGGMGPLSTLTSAQVQAITIALASTPQTPPAGTTDPAPAPTPTPSPDIPPTTTVDGSALYTSNCANCHGALATSTKKGITLARLDSAINSNIAGKANLLSALTMAEKQAIMDALANAASIPTPAPTPSPIPTPTPTPMPTPTPVPINGAALYASNCAGCHGVLAGSSKAGATLARLQSAINNNIAGKKVALAALSDVQLKAIVDVLATVTTAPAPAPTPVCGSCHAIPPAKGSHSDHRSRSCSTCHGSGYSSTAVNKTLHNNGVKNVVSTIGWNPTSRTCANSCHGRENW